MPSPFFSRLSFPQTVIFFLRTPDYIALLMNVILREALLLKQVSPFLL